MRINDLQCSDDGTSYSCLVGDVFNSTLLNVKVRPSVPTLSNVQTDVQENSNITATCTAVVGYPKAGQIVWKAYQNERSVNLSSEFATSVVNVSQPGDDKCTVRTQSLVTLKVNRLHQYISLACFVTNPDFKPTAPETCTDPEADFCAMTELTVVTYVATPFFFEILTTETEPATTATSKAGEDTTEIFTTITMETFPAAISDLLKTSPEYNAEQTESTSKLAPRLDNTVSNVTAATGSNPGVTKSSTNLNTDFISMLAMGLILSAIIIIQFVVIIIAIRRSQGKGPCRRKVTERTHHTYNQPERESDYDYINDSYYKNLHLIY
nr:cell adhesion molecule 2-like [Biomphalaria glabrata]